MFATTYDVIVVGARCAGAATAMLMARKGLRVLLVERDAPGTDTLSTHNLTRGAVTQLVRWGLVDDLLARGTPRLKRTTFYFGETVLPLELKPTYGAPGLLGTRRAILDATLVDAARQAGADVHFHTAFRDVIRDATGRVTGVVLTNAAGQDVKVSADLIVGADGIRSTVARRVHATLRREAKNRLGHIYSYYRGLPLADNHAYFGRGTSAASTVTDDGAAVVVASTTPEALRQLRSRMDDEAVLHHLAAATNVRFGALLSQAERIEHIRVFAGTKGFVRDCAGPGWALVGDAGYFRDPVTAHGITDAFRDAELLAAAAGCGDVALGDYQRLRNEVTADIWQITDRIAAFDMDIADLQDAFRQLAQAMKEEQAWMSDRFDSVELAA